MMGVWGVGINQDDTVADVIGFIDDCLKSGATITEATSKALQNFKELKTDDDEEPLLWLAVASAQWKYGELDTSILNHVRADITAERGLKRWRDDNKLLIKRKEELSKFLSKIEVPNPKPASFPKLIIHKAPFAIGDCLAVQLIDGRFTAALVLNVDNSNQEYGKNLIAGLNYLSTEIPRLDVFKKRQWLLMHHGEWQGKPDLCWYLPVHFESVSERITVVGNIRRRLFDPRKSNSTTSWINLGKQILLCRNELANY